jgi:hypothetical protein
VTVGELTRLSDDGIVGRGMHYLVIEARYVRDYVLWIRFRDGTSGEVDLQGELRGPVFEPLKDLEAFQQFHVSSDIGTVAWPNQADIAPETLYALVRRGDFETPRFAGGMPEISRFHGIVISMYYNEHGRPHFHAQLSEHAISVEIERLVVRGEFPGVSLRLVLDWAEQYRAELLANWERARSGLTLLPIPPLP